MNIKINLINFIGKIIRSKPSNAYNPLKPLFRKYTFYIIAIILFLGVLSGFVSSHGHDLKPENRNLSALNKIDYEITPIFLGLLVNLLSSSCIILVILFITRLGFLPIDEAYRKYIRYKKLGKLPDFWLSGNPRTPYIIICGREPAHLKQHEPEPRVGYAEAYGALLLMQTLEEITNENSTVELKIVDEHSAFQEHWFNNHVVILGSELSVEQFGKISRAVQVPYFQYSMKRDDRSRRLERNPQIYPNGCHKFESEIDDDNNLQRDFGSVVRIIRPNDRLLVLLNGNYGAGLIAAIFSVTKRGFEIGEEYNELLDEFYPDKQAQEAIVEIKLDGIKDNLVELHHQFSIAEDMKTWLPFECKGIEGAIQKSCTPPSN